MTLLQGLRKIRHPIVINELKKEKNIGSWYSLGSMPSTAFKYDPEIEEVHFGYTTGQLRYTLHRKYDFLIKEKTFSLRITEWEKNESYGRGKRLADILNIPYNDEPEALLFQLSMENNFCTFGVNEMNAIMKFRERFWGLHESAS